MFLPTDSNNCNHVQQARLCTFVLLTLRWINLSWAICKKIMYVKKNYVHVEEGFKWNGRMCLKAERALLCAVESAQWKRASKKEQKKVSVCYLFFRLQDDKQSIVKLMLNAAEKERRDGWKEEVDDRDATSFCRSTKCRTTKCRNSDCHM
jgi:hypothetical protein